MFEFLTQAQHEMLSRLEESTFLLPTYLERSKDSARRVNTRGSWEKPRQLCKPETQSRVCITIENFPNSPEVRKYLVRKYLEQNVLFLKDLNCVQH